MRSAVGGDDDVDDGAGDDLETGGLAVEVEGDAVGELLLGACSSS